MTIIRFGCSIRLPDKGKFLFRDEFVQDPQKFLHDWISGAVSNIYAGPTINLSDDHDGHLIYRPIVRVKYIPNKL